MDRLYFFSNSADKPPGKGANEVLNSGDSYQKLSKIPDWRKVLSNFYESPIKIDGLTFLTVEHYYQGSKFRKENPDFYREFSLESGSDISKDPSMAKSAGGKSGKYKGHQIRPVTIKMDSDFDRDRAHAEMERALSVKFSQPGLPQEVLLATGDAELWHGTRGVPPFRQVAHEKIRDQVRNQTGKDQTKPKAQEPMTDQERLEAIRNVIKPKKVKPKPAVQEPQVAAPKPKIKIKPKYKKSD